MHSNRDVVSDRTAGSVFIKVPKPSPQLFRNLNRPGFTGGQNSWRIARYGTDIKEEDLEAVFARRLAVH